MRCSHLYHISFLLAEKDKVGIVDEIFFPALETHFVTYPTQLNEPGFEFSKNKLSAINYKRQDDHPNGCFKYVAGLQMEFEGDVQTPWV